MNLTRILLPAALALLAAASLFSQAAPRGTVTGTVTNASGPIVGITVTITSSISGYTGKMNTDQTGTYTFSDAPVGGVTVRAQDQNGTVLVTATGTLNAPGEVLRLPLRVP